MKVRKEQCLLPKAKHNILNKTKWMQSNRNPCEYATPLNCTTIPPPIMEGLPSALITKMKPEMLLSNGDFLVSSHSGAPMLWQQHNGILRQALLCNGEKDVKSEDNIAEPITIAPYQNQNDGCVITSVATNTNLLTITAVNPQQISPIAAPQVIKMNDYQVIVSSETLSVPWLETGKKSISSPISSIQPIKSKSDGILVAENQLAFTSIENFNVLKQNHVPTVFVKEVVNSSSGDGPSNISEGSPVLIPNKTNNRTGIKSGKPKRKPANGKKIMLKPASSLLSQTALDYTNKGNVFTKDKTEETIILSTTSSPSEVKSIMNVAKTDFSTNRPAEPVALVSSSSLPVSSSSIVITSQENIYSYLPIKPLTSYQQNYFPQSVNSVKCSETPSVYMPNMSVIEQSVPTHEILTSTESCIVTGNQTLTLTNTSTIVQEVMIDSNTRVICSNGQPLLCSDSAKNSKCSAQNNVQPLDQTVCDEYRDHAEAILPMDIDHNEEHPTQEYTDNLLSQLSDARALPNMSSSQVSSVLNALGHLDKADVNGLGVLNSTKSMKEPVKCEPTEFVKIESLHLPNSLRLKSKSCEPKYRICELNKHTCYRCVNCMYLSLKAECVEKHWSDEHQSLRADLLDKQITKRPIKCFGCTNVLYSKYSLQIHLLCDHNVTTTEVHSLIAATIAANKAPREAKRLAMKQQSSKIKATSQQIELSTSVPATIPSTLLTSSYETSLMTLTETEAVGSTAQPNVVIPDTLVDERKHVSDEVVVEVLPTPDFCLFSDIQISNEKEVPILADYQISVEDESKEPSIEKKDVRSRKCKSARKKLKSDYGSEIKFNYRCNVERCGVRVSSLDNLDYHLNCHKDDSDLLFCPKCEFSVVNWSSLTPHLWRQHKLDIDLYSCKYCDYKCNSFSKLMNNHVKIHGDERPFLCDICGKGFKTTKQLRNHKGIHRARRKLQSNGGNIPEDEEVEYLCNICGRSFADSRILRHHTESVHNKSRPFVCSYCPHTASSKGSLRMHTRQHTGEKPFKCNECEYITADHNSLRRHKMRHTGMRPYQCPHCAYNCIQSTTYKAHLKNKHPGLDEGLMFSCPMCPFRTVKRDNYLTHKAEHDLGVDPRNRWKKTSLSEDQVIHCKPITYYTEQDAVIELLDSAKDLSSVESETIELIVPEESSI